MKPTQIIELFANIRKTFVSFFSILMFVALGVGIFLGINWTSPALEGIADSIFDDSNMYHVQVLYPYGLTDDDLDKLSKVEGVTSVEKARLAFVTYIDGGSELTFKLQTVGQDISQLVVKEGELPKRADEMALKESVASKLGLKVGDTIAFKHDADQSSASATVALSEESEGSGSTDGNKSGMKQLTTDSFKVTALVESPDYLANEKETFGTSPTVTGSVDALAWVTSDAFDDAAYLHGYTLANVRSESLQGKGTCSPEYKQASIALEDRISELGDELASARYDDLHGQAQKKVDEGDAQLAEGEAKIAEGEQAIADGTQKLEEGRATLAQKRSEGEVRLDAAHQELLVLEGVKAEGEKQLAEVRELLSYGQQALAVYDNAKNSALSIINDAGSYKASLKRDLEDGKITREEYRQKLDKRGRKVADELIPFAELLGKDVPLITHENYSEVLKAVKSAISDIEDVKFDFAGQKISIREGRARLKEFERKVAEGEAEYNKRAAQLNDGWNKYYEGQRLLETETARGEQQIAEGEAKLEEAKQQVEEGKDKVAEMKPKLESAKEQTASMEKLNWTVMGRSANGGVVQVATFSGVTGRLSLSMAALFIIVGLLVSYSAVSRIVREQITQIGTKKALGLRTREINVSYLLYSAIAVFLGTILGAILGFTLVEGIISRSVGSMFFMGPYPSYFGWPLFLAIASLELGLILLATWLACHSILREHAVELLKGEKPPKAKVRFYEKRGLWEKLPLFTQTIVNNCVNDKRRLFSTVVGVAGCTALIVTAITLNDDVLASYDRHYDDIYNFNAIAFADNSVDGAAQNVEDELKAQGATTAQALRKSFLAEQGDGTPSAMRVIVPSDNEAFSQVYHVKTVEGVPFDPSGDGVWVTQAFASHMGAKVGDKIALDGGTGETHTVRIEGFYDFNLTYHELIMGRDYYERVFGTKFVPNVVLADTKGTSVDDLKPALTKIDGFYSISDDKTYQKGNFDTFSGVSSTVVLIYLVLAALMAVVVLLNLNFMFIEEKKRDLIVLMINGFSVHDAKRYIYNDTIVLTLLGIALGLVFGCIMGSLTVASIEPETALFLKGVAGRAILAGAVGSALLAFVMSFIALLRIPRFNLTDINRF